MILSKRSKRDKVKAYKIHLTISNIIKEVNKVLQLHRPFKSFRLCIRKYSNIKHQTTVNTQQKTAQIKICLTYRPPSIIIIVSIMTKNHNNNIDLLCVNALVTMSSDSIHSTCLY